MKSKRKFSPEFKAKVALEAMCPKPKTTVAASEHKKYPYLLRGLDIVRPNQVW
ncbi:MAG: hypothetical protein IJT51_04630 [Bacteroidales bacterium]|nr:hypothetical protein [Bacteroidales bacterium]